MQMYLFELATFLKILPNWLNFAKHGRSVPERCHCCRLMLLLFILVAVVVVATGTVVVVAVECL